MNKFLHIEDSGSCNHKFLPKHNETLTGTDLGKIYTYYNSTSWRYPFVYHSLGNKTNSKKRQQFESDPDANPRKLRYKSTLPQ